MNAQPLFRFTAASLPLAIAMMLAACDEASPSSATPTGREVLEREGNPDVVYFDGSDDLMNRSMEKAKASYTEFVAALDSADPTIMGLSVKKAFEATGGVEHIWISDVSWDGQVFSGSVGNEPVNVPGVVYGQMVTVSLEELSDWMYIRDGKLYGGYTIRAMLAEYSAEERAAMQQQMGFQVPEIDY